MTLRHSVPTPSRLRRAARYGRLSVMAVVNAIMVAGAQAESADPATAPDTTVPPAPKTSPARKDGEETLNDAKLNEVVVTAKQVDGYKTDQSANGKYTEPLRDVPQTITIIPQQVMKDQNATSLRDVLRNVSGITFQSGEGGSLAGDNLLIRGFSARSDLFLDGLRDSGAYNRDPFDIEQVEVSKGPASTYSGHGSTGGSVNTISKTPQLENFYGGTVGYGTDQYTRETVDVNQVVPTDIAGLQGTAVRLNAMYQSNDFADRDAVNSERWGFAPSITIGLGTDTRINFSYYHQQEDNVIGYGIPTVNAVGVAANQGLASSLNHPAPVDYSNFYGLLSIDHENTMTDIPTLKIEHDFDDNLKVANNSRYDRTYRDSVSNSPRFEPGLVNSSATAVSTLLPGNMSSEVKVRHQLDELLANTSEVTVKFDTWRVSHTAVGTIELYEEKETAHTANGLPIQLSLLAPDSSTPYNFNNGAIVPWSPKSTAIADTAAFSLFDTAKLTPQWELSYGMRFDHVQSTFRTGANSAGATAAAQLPTQFERTDDLPSWRTALVYKPVENGSFYFGYGTSFDPSIEGTAPPGNASAGAGTDGLTAVTASLPPEASSSYEFGTKWDLLHQKLSLTGAAFRTDKTNQRISDPSTGNVAALAGESRIQGFEFGAEGNLTEKWKIFGGYTYMQSKIVKAGVNVGNKLPETPNQSASVWTTYDLPNGFEVGTGAQYVDKRFENINNVAAVDGYVKQDAMLSYRINHNVNLQLNVVNLWDTRYIDLVGNMQDTPGTGRTVVLSSTFKY